MNGQGVPDVPGVCGVGVTQTEKDPAVGVLEVEVDPYDVELGPCRGPVGHRTGHLGRGEGRGVLGDMPADQVSEAGGLGQPVEHLQGAPVQQDAFSQPRGVRVALPHGGEHLDGNAQPVDARGLLHGVRLQTGELHPWYFLAELSQQGRLQGGVAGDPAAAEESEHAGLPDPLPLVAQMQQIAALVDPLQQGRKGSTRS